MYVADYNFMALMIKVCLFVSFYLNYRSFVLIFDKCIKPLGLWGGG